MIQLQGAYTFNAPQEVVWEAVRDPNVLSKVLPGCEKLEQSGENEYEGELNIRVGPVQGKFQGKITLSNILEPDSYHIDIQGHGQPGFVKGEGDLKLESDGVQTTLNYIGEAQISGRIASVGQRLMDSSARSITRQGLESLDNLIQVRLKASEPATESDKSTPTPTMTAPSTQKVAREVAKDVFKDLAPPAPQPSLRNYAVIGVGVIAILWFYRLLFGKN
jgi:carbon monoxide dehydrogenase subunit G